MAGCQVPLTEGWSAGRGPPLPVHGAGTVDPGVGSGLCGHVQGGTVDLQLLGCPGVTQPQSSREAIQ